LANAFYLGIAGTLVLYVIRKRKKKRVNCETSVTNRTRCRFSDKTVVITGGAGDIGMNTALAFAREEASIFLVDLPRTEENLKEKCKHLTEEGAKSAEYVVCDVTDDVDVKKMVKSISDKAGHIDVFFNNAGIQGTLTPLHKQDDEEFKRVINVNIYGVFLGMKYVSQAMMESKRGGVIINTASVAGLLGPANMAAYAASKFAVVGMTKTAAKDLARHRIRVCAIAPGILEGKMWDTQIRGNVKCRKEIEGDETEVSAEEIKQQEVRMIRGTPLERQGKLSEVASVVTFLSSEDASYLTGVTLPIDGGRIP
jgi:NAD(P)-dependent dehydrogenase (short-subunit alcohol dehydrogenase family)